MPVKLLVNEAQSLLRHQKINIFGESPIPVAEKRSAAGDCIGDAKFAQTPRDLPERLLDRAAP